MTESASNIEELKRIILDLAGKLDQPIMFKHASNLNDISLIKNNGFLNKDYIIQLQQFKLDNYERQIAALVKENKKLNSDKAGLVIKNNKNLEVLRTHEVRMREFFNVYRNDKKTLHKYLILSKKLENELTSLKHEVLKYEDKIFRIKNQMSYRLGSKLIELNKNKKNITKLPKELLRDYIDFRTNLTRDNSSLANKRAIDNDELQVLSFNHSIEHALFDKDTTVFLDLQFTHVYLPKNIEGFVNLKLYAVKPEASVEIEVKMQAIDGSCTFQFGSTSSELHEIAKGEDYLFNVSLNDKSVKLLLNIISNKGGVRFSFKKTQGVSSCIHIFRDGNKKDSRRIDFHSEGIPSKDTVIPLLKKPNATLFEAEQIIFTHSKEVAIRFAEKHTKNKFRPALNIFYANLANGSDDEWLAYINRYLKSFDCSPIKLSKDTDKKLYYRIRADKPASINSDIKVTIIMPAFNAEDTIKNSVLSILNQTWSNIEVIVVNDCSEDNTWSIIEKLADEDKRIIAINNPKNVGAYVSKNIGLKIATGHYVTGHDADDWAHPQRIEKHIDAINNEQIKPKASLTRMIRMEENGHFPFYLEGTFCLDGVLRVASITCMFELNFLRDTLGGWDCSRFGADSEIIARAKMVLNNEFKDYHQVSMICLDAPNSLTNNPIHGIQRNKGLSPSRLFYKNQWTEWHKSIDKNDVYLQFPHLVRKFDVPEGTEIPKKNILAAIENVENMFGDK